MLKRIVFIAGLGMASFACVLSICFMYRDDDGYKVALDSAKLEQLIDVDELYTVKMNNVEKHISIQGKVMPMYEDENVVVSIEGNVEKYVNKGDLIEKDTVYAKCRGKSYFAKEQMKCIDIKEEGTHTVFCFIDYSKLYVEAEIPEKYASDELIGKPVMLKTGQKDFDGELVYLDAYCESGIVKGEVKYKNSEVLLRPGSVCKVEMLLEEKENVIALPLEFVVYLPEEEEYRVILKEKEELMNVPIEVGIVGDEMVEVVSGVKMGDVIRLPEGEMSLKYYLKNGGNDG